MRVAVLCVVGRAQASGSGPRPGRGNSRSYGGYLSHQVPEEMVAVHVCRTSAFHADCLGLRGNDTSRLLRHVRVYTSDGKWVGGCMPEKAGFVATYPEPRDIFIPQQWSVSPSGEFLSQVEGTRGIYVPLVGTERVEWVAPGPDPTGPAV